MFINFFFDFCSIYFLDNEMENPTNITESVNNSTKDVLDFSFSKEADDTSNSNFMKLNNYHTESLGQAKSSLVSFICIFLRKNILSLFVIEINFLYDKN